MNTIRTTTRRMKSAEIKNSREAWIDANLPNVSTFTFRQIAEQSGVPKSTVHRLLRKLLSERDECNKTDIAAPPCRETEIALRLERWLGDKLDGNQWAHYSYREIAKEIGASHHAVHQNLIRLVAKMTGRQLDELRALRQREPIQHYNPKFVCFCIQQLHDREWNYKDILFLLGVSPTTLDNCIRAPRVELPPDTGGWYVPDELRRVLKDELKIRVTSKKSGRDHT